MNVCLCDGQSGSNAGSSSVEHFIKYMKDLGSNPSLVRHYFSYLNGTMFGAWQANPWNLQVDTSQGNVFKGNQLRGKECTWQLSLNTSTQFINTQLVEHIPDQIFRGLCFNSVLFCHCFFHHFT